MDTPKEPSREDFVKYRDKLVQLLDEAAEHKICSTYLCAAALNEMALGRNRNFTITCDAQVRYLDTERLLQNSR